MAKELESIRQNSAPAALPDLGNLGVMLRVLLAVNGAALLVVLLRSTAWTGLAMRLGEAMMWVEPILIASLLVLGMMHRWLDRLSYRPALVLAASAVAIIAGLHCQALRQIVDTALVPWQAAAWSALAAALLLHWLALAQRARSPALAEARLMALTARIRPHFLFNSLNAVLGVMRADPRRAENALEELAELFRALMQDPRELVPLSEEIALSRRYLDLERLRLGERLQVTWDVESCPPDALLPPLMLQPLLENAVYHGIEPAELPGAISIRLACVDNQIKIELSNPLEPGHAHAKGNQMALANIRERLMLFYDLEASLATEIGENRYTVRIALPYHKR